MSKKPTKTIPFIRSSKRREGAEPLVMVTAYDAPSARVASESDVDLILVGDSVAMVVLGYTDTLQVTVDDMAHHTAAVARAKLCARLAPGRSARVAGNLPGNRNAALVLP